MTTPTPGPARRRSWLARRRADAAPTLDLDAPPNERGSWRGAPADLAARTWWWVIGRILLTAAVVGLLAFLVRELLTVRRFVPVVSCFITGYRSPYSPLPMIAEDRDLLGTLASAGGSFFQPPPAHVIDVSDRAASATADELVETLAAALRRARTGGPGNDVAIVHLSAIGTVDEAGRACIVPPGAATDPAGLGDESLLVVDRLLASLRAAVPDGSRLVVVLDASRVEMPWPLGIDAGGFAAGVRSFMAGTSLKRTWVLLPSSVGQRSNVSLAAGCSVWMQEFVRGLRGAADDRPAGDRNGRVQLRELAAYLVDRVDRLAMETSGDRQTPLLLGSPDDRDADPALGWATRPDPTSPRVVRVEPADDAWLAKHWQNAASMRDVCVRDRPLLWSTYLHMLTRAEILRTAGAAYRDEQLDVAREVERIESRLTLPLISDLKLVPGLRLALATAPSPGAAERTREWIDALAGYVTPPPDGKPGAKPPPRTTDLDEWLLRCEAAWHWLTRRVSDGPPLDRGALSRWLESIDSRADLPTFNPSQFHVLRMLLRWTDADDWQRSPELFRDLILLVDTSREAVFGRDVRADTAVFADAATSSAYEAMRRALDRVFVGGERSLAEARADVRASQEAFGRIVDTSKRRSRLLYLVDEVRADAPHLAAWWVEEQRHAARVPEDRESAALSIDGVTWTTLLSTIDRLEAFNQAIVSTDRTTTDEAIREIEEAAARCEQAFDAIRGAYESDCADLGALAPESPRTLGAIRRVLAVPLVMGEARMQLLRRADELDRGHVDRQRWESGSATRLTPEPAESAAATAGWIVWRDLLMHPVQPLMGIDIVGTDVAPETAADIAAAIGKQTAVARNAARSLPGVVSAFDRQRETVEAAETDAGPRGLELLARAAAATGRLAAVAGQRPQLVAASTPTQRSIAAAWHARLVRHAELTLDDFWAGVDDGEPVYCTTKAGALLDVAREVVRANGVVFGDADRRRIAARIEAIEAHGPSFADLRLDPSRILLPASPNDARPAYTLGVRPRAGVPRGLAAAWLSESADAAPMPVLLETSRTDAPPARRIGVPIDVASPPGAWELDVVGAGFLDLARSQVVDLNCWYRGHRVVLGTPVAAADATRTTAWERRAAIPPRLTVRGDAVIPQAVSIVFDCSGSMGQRTGDGRTRLAVGREAVRRVVEQLAKTGRWEISLWLYGHRTRWSRDPQGRFTPGLTPLGETAKAKAGDGKPFTLLPGDDVEQVLPMEELTAASAARFADLLAAVEPGGETPLYLAISDAVDADFVSRRAATPGHVVVVTDGANDQTGGRIVTAAGLEDRLARLRSRRTAPLKVDIIGFALGEDAWQRASKMDDARNLATSTGGKFVSATDAGALTRALRESMRLERWRAVGPGAPATSAELGESIDLPVPPTAEAIPYEAVLETGTAAPRRRFLAAAGESLEMFSASGGRALEFRRYDGGMEQGIRDARTPVVDPADSSRRSFVAAHLATRKGDDVLFPISIQNADPTEYSRRPAETWVDITPLDASGTPSQPYTFYDPDFEDGRPVPLLECIAPRWPREAVRAEISVWFRFEPVKPDLEIPLASLADGQEHRLSLPGLPDTKVIATLGRPDATGDTPLTVIEQHPAAFSGRLPFLRLSVSAGVSRVTHTVEQSAGRVRHDFVLRAEGLIPLTSSTLTVTDRQRILSGACSVTADGSGPLTVQVPRP